jgi:hypothetical protein
MLIPLFILLFIQAAWIFNDAPKRGENKWIWGFFGLLNVPSSLIIYLIVTRGGAKACPCENCRKKVRYDYRYCPHCGISNNNFGKNK